MGVSLVTVLLLQACDCGLCFGQLWGVIGGATLGSVWVHVVLDGIWAFFIQNMSINRLRSLQP